MNKKALNICVQVFSEHTLSMSLSPMPESTAAGLYEKGMVSFISDPVNALPKVIGPFCILISDESELLLIPIPTSILYVLRDLFGRN